VRKLVISWIKADNINIVMSLYILEYVLAKTTVMRMTDELFLQLSVKISPFIPNSKYNEETVVQNKHNFFDKNNP
jgi:hypothetical protein